MLVQSKLEHCSVIGSYLELQILDLGLLYMDGKVRHRPTTLMGVQDLKMLFSSPNYSNNREVRIYPAAQTLFSVQPISRVLEVQMTSIVFPGKIRQFPRTFMVQLVPIMMLAITFCSDKKIRIFTKSRVGHLLNNQSSNQQFKILIYKKKHLPCIQDLGCSYHDHALYFFLYIFVMFKFYFMLYFP